MPLEALRYPVTPVGLHYLLIHFDVPDVDPDDWRLTVRGERELTLDLAELRQRPRAELVVPGWYGMTSVKWLAEIEVVDEPFAGYQQTQAYRLRQAEDEEGTALQRIVPRSLFVPPGIPEFLSRDRIADAGEHVIQGRAWS